MKQRAGFLLTTLLAACLAAAQTDLTLSGTVLEKGTGKPLERTKVVVVGGNANIEITGSDGVFILKLPTQTRLGKTIQLHFEKDGYGPLTTTVAVSPTLPYTIFLERVRSNPRKADLPPTAQQQSSPEEPSRDPKESRPTSENKPQRPTTAESSLPAPRTEPRLSTGIEAYKNLTNQQVAQWTVAEADKIGELSEEYKSGRRGPPGLNDPARYGVMRFFFTTAFKECCLQDVRDLRTEVLSRLGPPGKDPDEQDKWEMTFEMPVFPGQGARDLDPFLVQQYAPYLRLLGLRLRRTVEPRKPAKLLRFEVAQQAISEKEYRAIATISVDSEISAGYIVVEVEGGAFQIACDFENSHLTLTDDSPIDNREVRDYIARVFSQGSTAYALTIGKTPLSPQQPIHVQISSSKIVHVARVTLFDE